MLDDLIKDKKSAKRKVTKNRDDRVACNYYDRPWKRFKCKKEGKMKKEKRNKKENMIDMIY